MTTTTTYRIDLPWPRPPLNLNDRNNRWAHAKLVKEIRETVGWMAKAARIPFCDHVTVQLVYAPGRKGRRDGPNWVATSKPAIDGIVDAGVVRDDCGEYLTELPVLILPPPEPGPRCWLTVEITPRAGGES